jgi:hypothetical protein
MATTALAIVGQVFGFVGGMKTAKAERRAEGLRARQMELEGMRKKRENIRQAQIQRAEVTSNAVSSGAGESSALAGGLAGITGSQNRNNLAVNQDLQLGREMFRANAKAAKGRGISAVGDVITGISNTLSKAGEQFAIGGY